MLNVTYFLSFLAFFCLTDASVPSTCDGCVAQRGMSWRVEHYGSTVAVECVRTKDCNEGSTKEKSTVCFSQNCSRMPESTGTMWWNKGVYHYATCDGLSDIKRCVSQSPMCAYVMNKNGDYRCEFKAFTKYLSVHTICDGMSNIDQLLAKKTVSKADVDIQAKGSYVDTQLEILSNNDIVYAERKISGDGGCQIKKCGECVAKKGMTWAVELSHDGTTSKATTHCIPSSECHETSNKNKVVICFTQHCDKFKSVDEGIDWTHYKTKEYIQCAFDYPVEKCIAHDDCVYLYDTENDEYYCSFEQFTPWIKSEPICLNN